MNQACTLRELAYCPLWFLPTQAATQSESSHASCAGPQACPSLQPVEGSSPRCLHSPQLRSRSGSYLLEPVLSASSACTAPRSPDMGLEGTTLLSILSVPALSPCCCIPALVLVPQVGLVRALTKLWDSLSNWASAFSLFPGNV